MATIASSIALRDNMTSTITGMLRSMNSMISTFESIEKASQNAIDTKSLAAARSEINKAGAAFKEFENNVKSASEKQEVFNNSSKNMSSTMLNTGSSSAFMIAKIAAIPAVISAAGLACVKAAADMETTKVAFTTMLGSADRANSTLAELQSFAANTPFEFTEVTAAAKSLLAFGISAEDLTTTLTSLGDVSSGISAPIGEIAEIYGKAKVQGRLFAEDINQLTGRGIPIIQQLAKQFGVAEGSVKGLVENGEVGFGNLEQAFKDLTKEGSQFGGLMKAQSATLNGVWSNLMDSIGQSSVIAGNLLVEAFNIKGAVTGAIDTLGKLTDALKSQEFQRFVDQVGKDFSTASGNFEISFDAIAKKVHEKIPDIQKDFASLKTSWDIFFATVTGDGNADWGGIGKNIGDILTFVSQALIQGTALGTDFVTMLTAPWVALGQFMTGFVPGNMQRAQETFNGYLRAVRKFVTDVMAIFVGQDQAKANAAALFGSIGASGIDALTTSIDNGQVQVTTSAARTVDATALVMDPLTGRLTEIGNSSINGLNGSILNGQNTAGINAQVIHDSINNKLTPLQGESELTGNNIILGMVNGLNANLGLDTAMDNIVNMVIATFKLGFGIHSPSTVFYGIGTYIMQGLINSMTDSDIAGFVGSMVEDIKAAFSGGNFNLASALSWLGTGAEDILKAIGISLPKIGNLIWPTASQDITSGFGSRIDPVTGEQSYHEGIDIGAAFGDAVSAAAAGTVIAAGYDGNWGNKVEIDHGNGLTTLYAHLSAIDVAVGQIVSAGQKIGEVGSTGKSTGPHLHYGVYQDGMAIDPTTAKVGGVSSAGGDLAGWINQAMAITGVGAGNFQHLYDLAMAESGGDPKAINNWDSNAMAGTPSMGLMQTIQSTFDAYSMGGSIWDPVANAVAAIRYMIATYGSIANTPLTGYATGTNFATRGLHLVGEKGPEIVDFGGGETVLNAEKSKSLLKSVRSSNNGNKTFAPVISVSMGDTVVNSELDVDVIAKKLGKKIKDEIILEASGLYEAS